MLSPRRAREIPVSIVDRLSDRLSVARAAFDRRHNATPPNRRPSARVMPTMSPYDPDMIQTRERAVLRSVFRELGETHRQYRFRTGNHGTPELRAAAIAFKGAPSEVSLLPVATMLDELKLLPW
jgi:hypothetical protein